MCVHVCVCVPEDMSDKHHELIDEDNNSFQSISPTTYTCQWNIHMIMHAYTYTIILYMYVDIRVHLAGLNFATTSSKIKNFSAAKYGDSWIIIRTLTSGGKVNANG